MHEPTDHPNPASSSAPKVSDPSRVRACDLYGLFCRAADHAAQQAVARGLGLILLFDPALRETRLACPATAAQGVEATIDAVLGVTLRGAVSLCAGIDDDGEHVRLSVSGLIEPSHEPNGDLFALASEQARALGGRLMVERQETNLMLSLIFPATPSPMAVLLIGQGGSDRDQSADALRAEGVVVDLAETGAEALSLTTSGGYVAVLSDLYLEDEDTLQLVGRLRRGNRPAPVFAVSRSESAITGWALARAGFAGILTSPVTPSALRRLLASVEAAELKAVQQGEDAEENADSQDRDHGRTGSAIIRSA